MSWPGRAAPKLQPPAAPGTAARPCLVQAAALPKFLSPFAWRIVRRFNDGYELTDLDLLDGGWPWSTAQAPAVRRSLRFPDRHDPAVIEAAAARPAQVLLAFARFPAARVLKTDDRVIVSWIDVRFAGGITSLTARRPSEDTFRATVELDANGRILSARLGGN